jgi:hypothetical protein
MLLLTSTSDKIQLVTGASGASVDVHCSWVDNASGTITPGRFNVVGINTATTTDIVAAPGASTQRNVKAIYVTNTHATVSTQATVVHTDGTNVADLMGVTLLPGENLVLDEDGSWHHHDSQGAEYNYSGPPVSNLGITGTLAETMPRETCPEVNTTVAASGTLFMQAIYLKAGQLVSNITLASATTAAGTPTNYFAALYDVNRNLLAQSANQTTTAWAANTVKTFAMTTPYRVQTSGVYYIGYFMTATTVATLKGGTAKTGGQLAGSTPILHGTSTTGLTTSLPNPAAAITVGTATIYGAVS